MNETEKGITKNKKKKTKKKKKTWTRFVSRKVPSLTDCMCP